MARQLRTITFIAALVLGLVWPAESLEWSEYLSLILDMKPYLVKHTECERTTPLVGDRFEADDGGRDPALPLRRVSEGAR